MRIKGYTPPYGIFLRNKYESDENLVCYRVANKNLMRIMLATA